MDKVGRIAEFKISVDGATWEDIPVMAKLVMMGSEEANRTASKLADIVQREVRWNWAGSPQGHYVGAWLGC